MWAPEAIQQMRLNVSQREITIAYDSFIATIFSLSLSLSLSFSSLISSTFVERYHSLQHTCCSEWNVCIHAICFQSVSLSPLLRRILSVETAKLICFIESSRSYTFVSNIKFLRQKLFLSHSMHFYIFHFIPFDLSL